MNGLRLKEAASPSLRTRCLDAPPTSAFARDSGLRIFRSAHSPAGNVTCAYELMIRHGFCSSWMRAGRRIHGVGDRCPCTGRDNADACGGRAAHAISRCNIDAHASGELRGNTQFKYNAHRLRSDTARNIGYRYIREIASGCASRIASAARSAEAGSGQNRWMSVPVVRPRAAGCAFAGGRARFQRHHVME